MATIYKLSLVVLGVGFMGWGSSALAQPNSSSTDAKTEMKALDTDSDGTMDLKEANAAADKRFDALDTDHDGTLDKKEAAAAGISEATFEKLDTDKDGTLDKKEYATLVAIRFKKADPDKDGTVSSSELASSKGQSLLTLLK